MHIKLKSFLSDLGLKAFSRKYFEMKFRHVLRNIYKTGKYPLTEFGYMIFFENN